MSEETRYISKPVTTLAELIDWSFPVSSILTLPLCHCDGVWDDNGYHSNSSELPKVIYCHDMAGGYLASDRTDDFTHVFPAFRFIHWHLIDIFIYFSHQFITIPPISWINLAHRQGVSVYGTVILESTKCDGFQSVFVNPTEEHHTATADATITDKTRISSYKDFAARLDYIRRVVGFEGWFINFEINLPKDKVSLVRGRIIKFLRLLKSLGSEVIWYDAVTWSGRLEFQNELTRENLPYMKAAGDGLFLNYNWGRHKLQRTQELAINAAMSTKVYVGIDCFGRGCIGGGGFGTVEALKLILDVNASQPDRPLSIALFAPGWVFENCDLTSAAGDPTKAFNCLAENDAKFWSLLAPYIASLRGRGNLNNSCTMLYRPTLPHLPVLQSPCDLCDKYGSEILFCTTCCSGQGLLPSSANSCAVTDGDNSAVIFKKGSQMSRQQIFPTCRELNNTLSTKDNCLLNPTFTAVQVLCAGYADFTGTCLCIKFQSINLSDRNVIEKSDPLTKSSLMELFLFNKNVYISKNAQFTIAVRGFYTSSDGVSASHNQQHEQQNQRLDELIDLKLFVDAFHCQSCQSVGNHNINGDNQSQNGQVNFKRSFLKADEAKVEFINNVPWILLHYKTSSLAMDNANDVRSNSDSAKTSVKQPNISPMSSQSAPDKAFTTFDTSNENPEVSLSVASPSHYLHLHRIGLTWSSTLIRHFLNSSSYLQLTSICKTPILRHSHPADVISIIQSCHHPYSSSHSSNSTDDNQLSDGNYGKAATRLRFPVLPKPYKLRRAEGVGGGLTGRIMLLRRYVSKLLDDERIELPWSHAVETRLYTERLIQECILASTQEQHKGDLVRLFEMWKNSPEKETTEDQQHEINHVNTGILELCAFWLSEERLIEKLFKVFIPRYRFYEHAYTSLYRIHSPVYPVKSGGGNVFGILELHGNPWPPVSGHGVYGRDLNPEPYKEKYLINVLLNAARQRAVINSSGKKDKQENSPSVQMLSTSSTPFEYELKPIG
ncbi:unnamed protein product [Trichobilharzia szidati]|nr:unnamed protein product [Trichobilharzia szidati]